MRPYYVQVKTALAEWMPIDVRREEVGRVSVLKAQLPRETWVLWTGSYVDALRRVEPVPVDEDDAQSRQRLAAPADWGPAAVGTIEHINRDAEQFLHP